MTLPETLRRTIQIHKLIPLRSLIVVAVSGGADSLALLHALHQIHMSLAFDLHVATLNHGLRGEAGAADARFVEQTASQWGIPVTVGQADVNRLAAEQNLSLEAAARQARYTFLASVVRQVGATIVATAHHADDQAETVLMRLLRGTGLRGLRGMAFQSPLPTDPTLRLIRPLLLVTRAEIEAYCQEHNLQPRYDLTNEDTSLLRNYIRREAIPQLRNLNPQIERTLIQLADTASVEDDFLEQQLHQSIAAYVTLTPDRVSLDRKVYRALHPALQRRFIHWAVAQIAGIDNETGYIHITAAVTAGAQGETGTIALLSGGLRLRVDYGAIVVERDDAPAMVSDSLLLPAGTETSVAVPGITTIPGQSWQLRAGFVPIEGYHARLNISEKRKIFLRTRRSGDVFSPFGLDSHTQRVKKWMVDHKVPQSLRDSIPLLVIDDQIAAILYGETWPISDRFSVKADTQQVLYLRAER